ncbi:hypothetical protein LSTR_LSTR003972 [Laodelphax striatellus]|uniref:Uncharacterized protein n=1 Tax=Laodelphax striatellus TaxID=195883 RepID=A0A482WF00_LAOST|nr:hypothetical protein LSTR_LSTR003972 [Laodelphax striatellus]
MSVEAIPSKEEDMLLEEGHGGFSFVYSKEEPTDNIAKLSVEDVGSTLATSCIAEPHDGSTPPPTQPSRVKACSLSASWDALKLGPEDLRVLPPEEGALDAAEEPAAASHDKVMEAAEEQLAESTNEAVVAVGGLAAASRKEANAVIVMPSDPQRPGEGVAFVTSTR